MAKPNNQPELTTDNMQQLIINTLDTCTKQAITQATENNDLNKLQLLNNSGFLATVISDLLSNASDSVKLRMLNLIMDRMDGKSNNKKDNQINNNIIYITKKEQTNIKKQINTLIEQSYTEVED